MRHRHHTYVLGISASHCAWKRQCIAHRWFMRNCSVQKANAHLPGTKATPAPGWSWSRQTLHLSDMNERIGHFRGGAKHTDPSYMGSLPPILQDLLPWLSGLRDPLTSLSTTISRLPPGPYKERWWPTLVSYYLSDANGLSWLCTHHLPAYKPRLFACVNTQLNIKWPVTSNSVLNLLS